MSPGPLGDTSRQRCPAPEKQTLPEVWPGAAPSAGGYQGPPFTSVLPGGGIPPRDSLFWLQSGGVNIRFCLLGPLCFSWTVLSHENADGATRCFHVAATSVSSFQGVLPSASLTLGLGCPGHCGVLSSTPGPHPVNARSANHRCPQTRPLRPPKVSCGKRHSPSLRLRRVVPPALVFLGR